MRRIVTCFASLFALLIAGAQDGTLDLSFDPGSGANGEIACIVVQPDGRILVGGYFSMYDGAARNGIARLNPDGTLDATFDPGQGANLGVSAIALQPDGKILVGGTFYEFNGIQRGGITRLLSNGQVDPGFDPGGVGTDGNVWAVVIQPDGRPLIAGQLQSYDGISCGEVIRLHANGALDASFSFTHDLGGEIRALAVRQDGGILIGGNWPYPVQGPGANQVLLLTSSGLLDTDFHAGVGANAGVESIALQPDARVLIAGGFGVYMATAISGIARLTANGFYDTDFQNPGLSSAFLTTLRQPDGKIVLGGYRTTQQGGQGVALARLNSNGAQDLGFNIGSGVEGGSVNPGGHVVTKVMSIAAQSDGKLLIGGDFTSYNGVARNRIARINGFDVGLDELSMKRPVLLPNPATNTVSLRQLQAGKCSVRIVDACGREVLSEEHSISVNGALMLDIGALRSGHYSVRIQQAGAAQVVQLVVH